MIKILIIDDEDIMRNCLCDVLTDDGYSVEVAREGIQGITLFENNPSDIVILDIKMPGLSGVEVLKIIKNDLLVDIADFILFIYSMSLMSRAAMAALFSLLFRFSGTSPRTIRCAIPSAIAVFPVPGSPMRMGLFLVRRLRI